MFRRFALIGSCCLLAAIVAVAVAAEDTALRDLRVRWEAATKAIQDMTIEQEMKSGQAGQDMTMQIKLQRKGVKFRSESQIQGTTTVTISDGTDYWMVTPAGPQKLPMAPQQPDPTNWQNLPENAHIAGRETVGDRACHIVEFEAPHGTTTRMWVDQESPTPVKVESKTSPGITTTILFSDFRKVYQDYEMPFKCEMSINTKTNSVRGVLDVLQATITTKSIKVNSGLDDKLFDAKAAGPAAVPTMPTAPKQN